MDLSVLVKSIKNHDCAMMIGSGLTMNLMDESTPAEFRKAETWPGLLDAAATFAKTKLSPQDEGIGNNFSSILHIVGQLALNASDPRLSCETICVSAVVNKLKVDLNPEEADALRSILNVEQIIGKLVTNTDEGFVALRDYLHARLQSGSWSKLFKEVCVIYMLMELQVKRTDIINNVQFDQVFEHLKEAPESGKHAKSLFKSLCVSAMINEFRVNLQSETAKHFRTLADHMNNYVGTTNFDLFLERVLKRGCKHHVLKPFQGCSLLAPRTAFVYHLHGTALGEGDAAPIVCAEDYTPETKKQFLKDVLILTTNFQHSLLFIGAGHSGLSDDHWTKVWEARRSSEYAQEKGRIVVLTHDDEVEKINEVFTNAGVTEFSDVISYGKCKQHDLAPFLKRLISEVESQPTTPRWIEPEGNTSLRGSRLIPIAQKFLCFACFAFILRSSVLLWASR